MAVNPQMRGKRIGSKLLGDFIAANAGKTVVLEIDPPEDEVSKRRLAFYERVGFTNTGRIFRHPSYNKNGTGHDLLILSYPGELDETAYRKFTETVTEKVLKYVD